MTEKRFSEEACDVFLNPADEQLINRIRKQHRGRRVHGNFVILVGVLLIGFEAYYTHFIYELATKVHVDTAPAAQAEGHLQFFFGVGFGMKLNAGALAPALILAGITLWRERKNALILRLWDERLKPERPPTD